MVEASQRPHHFFKKRRHLRQKLRKNIMFLSDLFQFVVFLPLLFFFSYGTRQWRYATDTCNKQKKKQWQGHNELKCRFPNAPTKTEPN
jgi:hypothetical protein